MIYYHSQTPGDLTATLACAESLPQGQLLLLRHSVRPPFPPGVFHCQVDLTPEGVQFAEALGARLGTKITQIDTSTSTRCVQTGEALLRGAGSNLSVQINPRLGDIGVYVADSDRTHEYMVQSGPLALVNAGLQGEAGCGLNPVFAASRELLRNLWGTGLPDGTLRIGVTHDTMLSLFLGTLAGREELDEAGWPRMLEGVLLWEEGEQLCWCWRGEVRRCPSQDWLA